MACSAQGRRLLLALDGTAELVDGDQLGGGTGRRAVAVAGSGGVEDFKR